MPPTAEEKPYLLALGRRVLAERQAAKLSRRVVALRMGYSPKTPQHIEQGSRRTRAATLEALARALVGPQKGTALLEELVALAGPALAPESEYEPKTSRDRERRARRRIREEALELRRLLRGWKAGTLTVGEQSRLLWRVTMRMRAAPSDKAAAAILRKVLRYKPAGSGSRGVGGGGSGGGSPEELHETEPTWPKVPAPDSIRRPRGAPWTEAQLRRLVERAQSRLFRGLKRPPSKRPH